MCGLSAIYNPDEGNVDFRTLESMTEALRHRGPDDIGFAFVGPKGAMRWQTETPSPTASTGIAMGHRRNVMVLEYLDRSRLSRLVGDFMNGDDSRAKDLWRIFSTEIWMREFLA